MCEDSPLEIEEACMPYRWFVVSDSTNHKYSPSKAHPKGQLSRLPSRCVSSSSNCGVSESRSNTTPCQVVMPINRDPHSANDETTFVGKTILATSLAEDLLALAAALYRSA